MLDERQKRVENENGAQVDAQLVSTVTAAVVQTLHAMENEGNKGGEKSQSNDRVKTIDLIGLVNQVDAALKDCEKPLTVAVMGCVVNGPGEAREADIGICGGKGEGLLIRKGQVLSKLPEDQLVDALIREIETMTGETL